MANLHFLSHITKWTTVTLGGDYNECFQMKQFFVYIIPLLYIKVIKKKKNCTFSQKLFII